MPLRASPDTIVRRGPGEGGGRARPFCWVLGSWTPLLMAAHGEPALPFQDAHRLPSYGDFTSNVNACASMLWEGGRLCPPFEFGGVRNCSRRPPALGVPLVLGLGWIALGPLAGVGQDCLGWGALALSHALDRFSACTCFIA